MGEYKTPGVYIKEKNAFGNSVVEAETAIPAFIGFTEKALNGSDDLTNVPWKISSMTEFVQYFGGAPQNKFTLDVDDNNQLELKEPDVIFTLYYQMVMFFANGGGTCYIVSVGNYNATTAITSDQVKTALTALEKEPEVTMIVVPEAVNGPNLMDIQQEMMNHCGKMANRFAILDVPRGNENQQLDKRMEAFQDTVTRYFSYGAAYFRG